MSIAPIILSGTSILTSQQRVLLRDNVLLPGKQDPCEEKADDKDDTGVERGCDNTPDMGKSSHSLMFLELTGSIVRLFYMELPPVSDDL